MADEKLIPLVKAAEILGVEPATLRKWVQTRKITHYRIGNRPRFKPSELSAFINRCRVQARLSVREFKPRKVAANDAHGGRLTALGTGSEQAGRACAE